ncbi:MAG TPA: response regulator transcription factor [Rhodocyclaceae bacterium]|nr:response regulator transcription factor [Rhodocyclaceae bacterium]HNB77630.1 response regulator transcription factor [Rhodocyclaceae bacterium]HNC61437.1 response regulator transcription factor [Rhodocyclaceae bacterium]HNH11747.1 response regulator transcription factor [Rhodocyclaceae bacterium]HNH97694.1 response regulator transcription factor [Rhodocyclaceae bacterium]
MIRILIVDDHMIIRRGLRQILSENPDIGDIHEAEDGSATLRCLRSTPVDVVLLDIALGERDGLDVLKTLHAEFPRVGVIMLSVYPENQFAVRAIKGGAQAYLNKGCSPDILYAAIAKVAVGGLYLTQEVAELLALNVRSDVDRGHPPHEALSNREFQVLQLLAQGRSVTQIAQQLALSANTISTYRARIFEKLGLNNPAELFSYAARHKLAG